MSPLIVGALLVAVLLAIAAAMVWQEASSRPAGQPLTYVLEDAVTFVVDRLGADAGLTRDDVRRILEWEIVYLQGVTPRRNTVLQPVRVGGSDEAVAFIAAQISDRAGPRYSHEAISVVLEGEAAYLASIGALGLEIPEEDA